MAFVSAACVSSGRRPRWGKNICASAVSSTEHAEFLRDYARVMVPQHLESLVKVLEAKNEQIVDPAGRDDFHPFFIPISEGEGGRVTGFLRWPTPPSEMDIPVVSMNRGEMGVSLLATSSKAFIKRYLAELDSASAQPNFQVPDDLKLKNGSVEDLGMGLERYLVLKVGPFPDLYEGLSRFHELRSDEQSSLICAERSSVAFPGWGRGHAFHCRLLQRIGRHAEAKDAAKYALQLPLWTLGDDLKEISTIAGYQDPTSLTRIFKRLAEDERHDEIKGGKPPEQVALDRAAYLLDYTYAEGKNSWKSIRRSLADLYEAGKAEDVAYFLRT
eukprot:Plantae.Rhodophyta-Purpureofilum_apyrenoidigerum.ctg11419.p1 GENE.Plantae.Rhodophyta-Purpureofilum_apyrenoidigerum.ctg11419~~Plantae.Rhodophyta-Purpureofilum_apyrenoidigerum.ctg11419.p1  ORF type:complete len:329 (+),score=45.68 Plantae.Rhodophyta-Purpureofilum_apyrenoidigerum.ctg11419:219-1205(+)